MTCARRPLSFIDSDCLAAFINAGKSKKLQVAIGQSKINGLSLNYESASLQSPMAIIGSSGYLEIAVNCGSARRYLGAVKGDAVHLILSN
ncbi:MAG: SAM-dependent chlorinase/fluorinase [Desulfobacterales bacterium]|uniref:SAM-dependent chlorinase/fluorinase n=1 Tax=Candidatus Desulfatibia vada TaxID=2841696 RepID=A0A8J6NSA8_9BACT|nr:SAM-dependent chlorinase/fluorinase [Candidatus Desulfatibia vada]